MVRLAAFAPTLLVWPTYLYVMVQLDAWNEVFSVHWPMAIAMICGSFLAGSTPLGGGVVAYPVSQLVLLVSTEHARDASVLVQSVGMNAAAWLIFVSKPELFLTWFIYTFVGVGAIGVLLGLRFAPSPGAANIVFATVVLMFGVAFFYASEIIGADRSTSSSSSKGNSNGNAKGNGSNKVVAPSSFPPPVPVLALMVLSAGLGGILTASVGSGSDIALFAFGVFGWNVLMPPELNVTQLALTASSVCVMGILSAFTSVVRALSGGFADRGVLLCWGADAFVVVLGAPIGSLVLTPTALRALRKLFYVLAALNFCGYVWVEPAFWHIGVWALLVPLLAAEVLLLRCHYVAHEQAALRAAAAVAAPARAHPPLL